MNATTSLEDKQLRSFLKLLIVLLIFVLAYQALLFTSGNTQSIKQHQTTITDKQKIILDRIIAIEQHLNMQKKGRDFK